MFAPVVGPRGEPEVDIAVVAEAGLPEILVPDLVLDEEAPDEVVPDVVALDGELDLMTDLALEEFVIDDDDYPEVSAAQRRVAPAASEPDRVDDIDQWLEEFAVSDCL